MNGHTTIKHGDGLNVRCQWCSQCVRSRHSGIAFSSWK